MTIPLNHSTTPTSPLHCDLLLLLPYITTPTASSTDDNINITFLQSTTTDHVLTHALHRVAGGSTIPTPRAEKNGFQNQHLTFGLLSASLTTSPSGCTSCSYPSSSLHPTSTRAHCATLEPRPLPPTQKRLRRCLAGTD